MGDGWPAGERGMGARTGAALLVTALVAALAGRARACGKTLTGVEGGPPTPPTPPGVGSPTDISVDDANMVKAANFAVVKYNMKSNEAYLYKTERIVTAKQQIVNGVLFYIEMYIGKTECRKTGSEQLESCAFVSPTEKRPLWKKNMRLRNEKGGLRE
ncbi:cystatin-C-like isoform X2 [Leucoraja erinacea]|uniref:cystatin-C-like isoform X2 n=1 Tax=Leucoraja erinaceus TaxID=7782 RepID=UPI0024588117|nr:cystatin-C-like isoform X2 [Leucoraja erinacea]